MTIPSIIKPQTDTTISWFLSQCHIHKYGAKSTIIHAGEKAETLYYIAKGSVAVLIKDSDGHEMILSYLNQGDFIGEVGLFDESETPKRTSWVKAKTACEIAEVSYSKFKQLVQVNPEILMRLTAQISHRLSATSNKVSNLAFLDVQWRLETRRVYLAHQPEPLTHTDVMHISNTRQQTAQLDGISR